jgi:4-amino-4-deoxy-L-arabinose transferase-like glycosyltransferase
MAPVLQGRSGAFALAGILLVAFTLRVAWRLHLGETDFWTNGYVFFDGMARSVAAGHGLVSPTPPNGLEGGWAMRQPLYPLFLAATYLFGHHWLVVVACEALFGVAVAACAFWLGRRWFGAGAGLVAATLAAIYPYYVVHDTALQDTSMVDAGAAIALCLLLKARASPSIWMWLAAGLAAGLAVLIRGTLLPFGAAALVWLALAGEGQTRRRLARAGVAAVALALVLGAWMARNEVVIGAPVVSTEIGIELYEANGPLTFNYYPRISMDRSAYAARQAMSPADRRAVAALPEAARSNWFMQRALAYMAAHPGETLAGAARKLAAGFSPVLNPERDRATEIAYALSYTPILALGLIGLAAAARRGWREQSLVWLQFAGFALVTAVFWAHTSHRVYLDVYLMVFAAPVILGAADWTRARFGPKRAAVQPM